MHAEMTHADYVRFHQAMNADIMTEADKQFITGLCWLITKEHPRCYRVLDLSRASGRFFDCLQSQQYYTPYGWDAPPENIRGAETVRVEFFFN